MITIYFAAKDNVLVDMTQLNKMSQAIWMELSDNKFLVGMHKGANTRVSYNDIVISFNGIATNPQNRAEGLKIIRFIQNCMGKILVKINLAHILEIKNTNMTPINGDTILREEFFKPLKTKNSLLLEGLVADENIPKEYKCEMTDQIMDDPIYTTERKDLRYDAKFLLYWLYTNPEGPRDPVTRILLDLQKDTIEDLPLKNKIQVYVQNTLMDGLQKNKTKVINVLTKYGLRELNDNNIEEAFLMASAANNVDDIKLLATRVKNVNVCCDKLNQTALHKAILRNALDAVRLLLLFKVPTNIKDTSGRTALDLATSCHNNDIRKLFGLNAIEQRNIFRALNSHQSIFKIKKDNAMAHNLDNDLPQTIRPHPKYFSL